MLTIIRLSSYTLFTKSHSYKHYKALKQIRNKKHPFITFPTRDDTKNNLFLTFAKWRETPVTMTDTGFTFTNLTSVTLRAGKSVN